MPTPGRQFFHGTVAGHTGVGGKLLPGTTVGKSVFAEQSDDSHIGGQHVSDAVYSSSREGVAWSFAGSAAQHDAEYTGVFGRPVVHEVKPSPDVKPGRHQDLHEFRSKTATVLQTHYAPPNGQPALLGENWNRYDTDSRMGDRNYRRGPDEFTSGMDDHRRGQQFDKGQKMAADANAELHARNTPLPGM